jgi:CRP-like cAMP-binding protein
VEPGPGSRACRGLDASKVVGSAIVTKSLGQPTDAVGVGAAPAFRNGLLGSVPWSELADLRPHLQRVTLVRDQVLHEAGATIHYVYFVEDGIVSLVADTADHGLVEVGMTGREGLAGAPALLGRDAIAVHRTVVQVPGAAFRAEAARLRDIVAGCAILRDRCMRHLQLMMIEASQTAACNARHELRPRLARWILMSHDRIDGDGLPITQEYLSLMLGVRRAGVSTAVSGLQSRRVIRQSRGRVTVLDRPALEAEACSCYRLVELSRYQVMHAGR